MTGNDRESNREREAELPWEAQRRIDDACDAFERAWISGCPVPIEDLVSDSRGAEQVQLVRELVALEFEYRRRAGQHPSITEYTSRFPGHAGGIAAAVDEAGVGPADTVSPRPQEETLECAPVAPPPGQPFGDYKLLERIGCGGMGIVYRAWQISAGRVVALKIIRPDYLDGLPADRRQEALERFRKEGQSAARLEHDLIVTVYEVGRAGGQPFYSMRYVAGQSLADKLADAPLDSRVAARYVEQAARGVAYAHRHGVVHRDIKPRNILIDDQDRPVITDFGMAKVLAADCDLTHTGAGLGTPSYMSPEQARDSSSASFASDIYGLGATLYSTLTGRPPHQAASPLETLRQVAIAEPVPPRELNSAVPPDLQTICLKCLQKEPGLRYPTAEELADDLARFVSGQSIHARPASRIERSWRWARRHPAAAAAAVVVVAGLVAVSAAAAALARAKGQLETANVSLREVHAREQQARALAETKRQEAERAREEEAAARKTADAVAGFLVSAFSSPDPEREGRTITVVELLERAVARLESEFADQPLLKAELCCVIGQTYRELGLYAPAVDLLEQSQRQFESTAGSDHEQTLLAMNELALAYSAAGRPRDAIRILEPAVAASAARPGLEHLNFTVMNSLAIACGQAGQQERSVRLHEQVLAWAETHLAEDDPHALGALNNLAYAYQISGQLDRGLVLQEKALERTRVLRGGDHPQTLAMKNNLALAYRKTGRISEARELIEHVLDRARDSLGPEHPNTVAALNTLADIYRDTGQFEMAVELFREAFEKQRTSLGPDHPSTLLPLSGLADSLLASGQVEEATALFEQALPKQQRQLGPDHAATLSTMTGLGRAYMRGQQWDRAEATLRACLEIRRVARPAEQATHETQLMLGSTLGRLQRYAEAEPLLLEGYQALEALVEPSAASRDGSAAAVKEIIGLYVLWGRLDEAARWRDKLQTLQTQTRPPAR